jgi:hypothetical protein
MIEEDVDGRSKPGHNPNGTSMSKFANELIASLKQARRMRKGARCAACA